MQEGIAAHTRLTVVIQNEQALNKLAPLGIISSYGLFARMTTFRHELIFEAFATQPDQVNE